MPKNGLIFGGRTCIMEVDDRNIEKDWFMQDSCLTCVLDDCNESNSGCLFISPQKRASERWYLKLKADPARYANYLLKKTIIKKKYLATPEGRSKWNAQCARYRINHPETMSAISKRYRERRSHARTSSKN